MVKLSFHTHYASLLCRRIKSVPLHPSNKLLEETLIKSVDSIAFAKAK